MAQNVVDTSNLPQINDARVVYLRQVRSVNNVLGHNQSLLGLDLQSKHPIFSRVKPTSLKKSASLSENDFNRATAPSLGQTYGMTEHPGTQAFSAMSGLDVDRYQCKFSLRHLRQLVYRDHFAEPLGHSDQLQVRRFENA